MKFTLLDCQKHSCFMCKHFSTSIHTEDTELILSVWCDIDSSTFPDKRCDSYVDKKEEQNDTK